MPSAAPSQNSPPSIVPFPQTGTSVVVVVVVVAAQPPATQASQQLGTFPTQACPPAGARHRSALDFLLQRVSPLAFVRQHVTNPGRPHVDFAAHWTTALRHSFGRSPSATAARATSVTHRTYAP
jgi:hypothetical protein